MFNATRLRFARERRGMTMKEVAAEVGITSRAITAYENDEYSPSEETLKLLAEFLKFPVEFFSGKKLEQPCEMNISFRAMTKLTAGRKNAAINSSVIAFMLNDWVEQQFNTPKLNLIDIRNETPEAAAEILRQYWGLGQLPIRNMIHLLEANGIKVFSLAEDTTEIDAFSLWRDESTPYIFLNTLKSAEHSRFDAAHELGHLVLHKHGALQGGQDAEREADAFAAAFLMPRSSVIASAPKIATLPLLIQLKKKWIISLSALVYRMHKLEILSEWQYRTLCVDIARKGYRTSEPEGAQREKSQIWEKIFSKLRNEKITKEAIAKKICVNVEEIEKLIFGLVLMDISNTGKLSSKRLVSSAKLKLIDN